MVSVAVFVTVFVALTVTVAAGIHLCGVEHECHVLEAVGTVVGFEGVEHAAFEQTGANYEHGAVNVVLDDRGVSHEVHRRGVDEDVLVAASHLVDELAKERAAEQLDGVGRYCAHGYVVEASGCVVVNDGVYVGGLGGEVARQSETSQSERLAH